MMKTRVVDSLKTTWCFHCGEVCNNLIVNFQDRYFCCEGCKLVYQLLCENDLGQYYDLNQFPGHTLNFHSKNEKYTYLSEGELEEKLISFRNQSYSIVKFDLPDIHCSSCIWLLQNISRFNNGIISSHVSFEKKEIKIIYRHQALKLAELAELLDKIGYPPNITLNNLFNNSRPAVAKKSLIYKLGIAGFCFGNIMLFSFPDYLGAGVDEFILQQGFRYLSLIISIPVITYCSTEFYTPAYYSIKNKFINIDVPVVIALLVTFIVSMYEIVFKNQSGYLDSLSGIVFFMLVGRWAQRKTYSNLNFNRNYKSFLPVSISRKHLNRFESVDVTEVKENDIIRLRYGEIIPFDGILQTGQGIMDYSFITGESELEYLLPGSKIFAGGKHLGSLVEIKVTAAYYQSGIAGLWQENNIDKRYNQPHKQYIQKISLYFASFIIFVALSAGLYHYIFLDGLAVKSITSVLIIACPCTLLLAQTYTEGFMLNKLALRGVFVKSAAVMAEVGKVDTVMFDKTGTLTDIRKSNVEWHGQSLTNSQRLILFHLFSNSNHPLSQIIVKDLEYQDTTTCKIENYSETEGEGITAKINNIYIYAGSASFVKINEKDHTLGSVIHVKTDNTYLGYFKANQAIRWGLNPLFTRLIASYKVGILSGDKETPNAEEVFSPLKLSQMHFNLKPTDKRKIITESKKMKGVIMVGDGLNDLAAFTESNVAIAIWNDENGFTPASDMIIKPSNLHKLDAILQFMKSGNSIILTCFSFSFIYNSIGLYYAVTGQLSPLISAVLMPINSLTVIGLSYIFTAYKNKSIDELERRILKSLVK